MANGRPMLAAGTWRRQRANSVEAEADDRLAGSLIQEGVGIGEVVATITGSSRNSSSPVGPEILILARRHFALMRLLRHASQGWHFVKRKLCRVGQHLELGCILQTRGSVRRFGRAPWRLTMAFISIPSSLPVGNRPPSRRAPGSVRRSRPTSVGMMVMLPPSSWATTTSLSCVSAHVCWVAPRVFPVRKRRPEQDQPEFSTQRPRPRACPGATCKGRLSARAISAEGDLLAEAQAVAISSRIELTQ